MVSGSWTGLGPTRMLDRRRSGGATPIHRYARNVWTFAMLYRWEFCAAMIFHMCWAPRTRIRILKKFSSITDENKDWPHEIWFERCQFATTLLTIFGSSRMWTFTVYVSDAVEKKSNGCFPMRKFHENRKFDISPLGLLCSVILAGYSVQSQRATQQQSQQSQSVGKKLKRKFPKRKFHAYRWICLTLP